MNSLESQQPVLAAKRHGRVGLQFFEQFFNSYFFWKVNLTPEDFC